MDTSLHTALVILAIFALILLIGVLCAVLFYTISILRVIREVVVLAQKKAQGLSIKASDLKRYVGGTFALRLLFRLFGRGKQK
jgi:hypothetical protein